MKSSRVWGWTARASRRACGGRWPTWRRGRRRRRLRRRRRSRWSCRRTEATRPRPRTTVGTRETVTAKNCLGLVGPVLPDEVVHGVVGIDGLARIAPEPLLDVVPHFAELDVVVVHV